LLSGLETMCVGGFALPHLAQGHSRGDAAALLMWWSADGLGCLLTGFL